MKRFLQLVQFCSDLHLEKNLPRLIIPKKPYLLLCGDIGHVHQDSYKRFLHQMSNDFDKVFLIAGNHEYDDNPNAEGMIRNICNQRNNLIFLQKEIYPIENIYLAGCTLWAAKPVSKKKYHDDHVKWLNNLSSDKNYVIATHHSPLPSKKLTKTSQYFYSDQTNILMKKNILGWIYGHTHKNTQLVHSNKPILTNQYGNRIYPISYYRYI